jgi:hypothetical protein
VNTAYTRFYKKKLADKVKSETSGDYGKLMVALCT